MSIVWTDQQVSAIRTLEDTLLVANAGTGKTTTVVGKIMWRLGLPFGEDEDGEPLPPPPSSAPPCGIHEIAAITFTEKAAYDLKRKLREAIEKSVRADELRWQIDRASVGTIHSFCAELLRENALRLGIDPTFDIMDGDEAWAEQDRLIKELVLERLEGGDDAARLLLERVKLTGYAHTKGVIDHVRDALREMRWHGEPRAEASVREALDEKDAATLALCDAICALGREAHRRWDAYLEDENRRDFDSLILDARALLTGDRAGPALRAVRARYRLLVVDEFQDTDFAQRDIAFAIGRDGAQQPPRGAGREPTAATNGDSHDHSTMTERHPPARSGDAGPAAASGAAAPDPAASDPTPQLFLVGDPKQSIYRFRGADIAVWNEVEASFREQGGRVLDLSRTFRSAPPIVAFVNHAARKAIESTGEELEAAAAAESGAPASGGAPSSDGTPATDGAGAPATDGAGAPAASRATTRVHYADLEPGVEPFPSAGVEWLESEGKGADARRESEAHHVAAWIRANIGELDVRDPDSGEPRKLEYRDCAMLYRTRTGLEIYEQALLRFGIPYYVTGAQHLNDRQEILDVLNALRLLQAPRDDMRALGFLRSPFVGLRDEAIARIRMLSESRAPLLKQARRWLDEERSWFEAPEHPELAAIERDALARGLALLDDLRQLAPRLPLDELIDELLERSGYRLHVLLMDRPEEVLANLQSLVHFAEQYRRLDLSAFFEVWDRSAQNDIGVPQAPLYSKDDDVVTLSTIHAAKGLEWPVVFLVGADEGFSIKRNISNSLVADPELGPFMCLKQADRGPHADAVVAREEREQMAEQARLLYVATTRARDRLVIVGKRGGTSGYDRWLSAGEVTWIVAGREGEGPRQLVRVTSGAPELVPPPPSPPPDLAWLDAWESGGADGLIDPLEEPPLRWIHSATELMLAAKDPEAWARRYRWAVLPAWDFAPRDGARGGDGADDGADDGAAPDEGGPGADDGAVPGEPDDGRATRLPAPVRGVIIHGVLERLEDAAELSRILDETIGSLDEPELEDMLSPGARYREQLEDEIRRVVESEEWAWYTGGEPGRDYWKELGFTHLLGRREWRFGAFDLFRRAGGGKGDGNLIVDFKTHPITAGQAERVARDYAIQADVYRAAAAMMGDVSVRLHFTGPNAVVEMDPP